MDPWTKLKLSALAALLTLSSIGCTRITCVSQSSCPDGSWITASGSTTTTVTVTGSFLDFSASLMQRDKSATQKTLREELAIGTSALPAGYRKVPTIGNDAIPTPGDDDGYKAGSVTFGARPVTPCGTTQASIEARIADCASANSAMATWDGSVSGHAGQGQWKLVTYNGAHEVWRDERTKLVWSDSLGIAPSWCPASGSSGGGPFAEADQYGYCNSVTYQPNQAFPESWCVEDPGLDTPATYDSMKGNMRFASTASSPSVVWRLPTQGDYHLAEVNGIKFPLPNTEFPFWTATVSSGTRDGAWFFRGIFGAFTISNRTFASNYVRCVGR